jgi:hypothetical protein
VDASLHKCLVSKFAHKNNVSQNLRKTSCPEKSDDFSQQNAEKAVKEMSEVSTRYLHKKTVFLNTFGNGLKSTRTNARKYRKISVSIDFECHTTCPDLTQIIYIC